MASRLRKSFSRKGRQAGRLIIRPREIARTLVQQLDGRAVGAFRQYARAHHWRPVVAIIRNERSSKLLRLRIAAS